MLPAPRRAHPTSAVPRALCLHGEQAHSRELSWEGRRAPRPSRLLLLPWKRLSWRVWFGSYLTACLPSMPLLGHEAPQLFLQQLGCSAFSSSDSLETVSFPKCMEKALCCSSRSDCWGAFPSSALSVTFLLGGLMWFGSGFQLAVFVHPGQGKSISCFSGSPCISVVVKQDLGVTKSFLSFSLAVSKPLFPPSCFYSKL